MPTKKDIKQPFLILTTFIFLFLSLSPNAYSNNKTTEELEKLVALGRKQVSSNIDSVAYFFDKAIEKAEALKDGERIVYLLREKGYYHEIYNQLEFARGIYLRALEQANLTKNHTLILDVLTDLAISSRKLGDYEDTKNYHIEALQLAKKYKDLRGIENNFHGLGYLYETIGEYELAVNYYLQSLEIAEEREEKPGIITTLQNISTTYAKIGNFQLAKKTIEQAYDLSLEVGDSSVITNVLHDHGAILEQLEDYDGALKKFHESLTINRLRMSKGTIARSLMYIANVYNTKKHFEMSEQYLQECLQYQDVMRDEDLAELYNKLGLLFLTKKDHEQAREAFLSSLKIAEKQRFIQLNQQNNYNLYQTYVRENHTAEALYHLEKSNALRDSIFNKEQSARMAELQFLYNTEKSEKQIHALESKQSKMMLYGSTVLFVLLLLFLIYLVRMKSKNNRTLKQKNSEIQLQNIKLKESNEVLQQFAWVAAHDLKEPLRGIGSFISLFQRKYGAQFNQEANEYMSYVTKGVHRMNDLLNALLQYSTISIQKPTGEFIDVSSILEGVSENLRDTIVAKNAEIHFQPDLPNLRMNELHVTQLFQNLISNSLKFAQTPVIQIQGKEEGEEIIFSIQDNGIGIKSEYENKIYKLFHQLDRNIEGKGIGLTICKNIVDKYNGKIWYESNEAEGTRFLVSFPKQLAA